MTELTPILTKPWGEERSWTLETYERFEGYQALRKALTRSPEELVQTAKDSGLRGRGGAGFPTGMKWGFLPPPDGGPRYLVVNADESEPGTCKDIPLLMASPQFLIEGMIITSYAIGCHHAFVYLRGEVVHVYRRLLEAVREAYEAGYLGKDILGSGFDLDITVHAGAGAYICGEETALLDSLEGRRGQPRLKPPFPAVAGLYARPTVVNNVESISSVPPIMLHGAEWFGEMGTEKSKGFGIFSLSGHVERPGQYEAPLGVTLRELLDMAGGIRKGHRLKFWTPVAPPPRSSPRNTSTCRSTSSRSPPTAPCSAPAPCRSSTRRSPSCVRSPGGSTSTPTSPAASARPAARARTGCGRSSRVSSAARVVRATSRSSTTSRATSSAGPSVRWATVPPAR
ncbi:NADH-quinone oxidoreductase subunit F [Mobilicoccus pelagius NBRC 104925]|uniref:NADH-quinone oxidoreductase subunit F n=1 Tax=Mobilicoccus pelagius NBRC 104925 TaxID=1089455 RepID=H5UQC8_9MICO|nr:NADH-quinone oxidoreductase subunit F [Mobilicoccus pelagius NBRC 104925]